MTLGVTGALFRIHGGGLAGAAPYLVGRFQREASYSRLGSAGASAYRSVPKNSTTSRNSCRDKSPVNPSGIPLGPFSRVTISDLRMWTSLPSSGLRIRTSVAVSDRTVPATVSPFLRVIKAASNPAVILFTSDTKVLSVLIFDLKESGDLGAIAVLGLMMLVLTALVIIAANRFAGSGAGPPQIPGRG